MVHANGPAPKESCAAGYVCMVAYTDYSFDARVRREAETLAANGFHVRCLTTRVGAKPARFVLNGVEVRELGTPKYRGKSTRVYVASYLSFVLRSTAACLRLLSKGELDVVHVHNIPDFLVVAGLGPRVAGRKVILDVHDSVPETFATKFSSGSLFRSLLVLEERLSARLAHRVICVNHPQRDALVSRGIPHPKTFVSMNVPDPSIFKPIRAEGGVGSDAFNLVYHGTMAARLGVDLIIRAVAALRSRMPRIRLHLWGWGDDLVQFQHLVTELRADDIVTFKSGGYPLSELPGRLCAMDLGVVANRRSEACDLMLPVKLMEYVSLGIPAIAPRLKTIQHYFSDEMVTFYEPEDVQSLTDAVERLFRQPGTRRRQADCARRFLTDYGWERQGVELISFYRKLLES